jgi:hypothetical protein
MRSPARVSSYSPGLLVNFMRRDDRGIHRFAPDCQALVSHWVTVRTEKTLLRLIRASPSTAS